MGCSYFTLKTSCRSSFISLYVFNNVPFRCSQVCTDMELNRGEHYVLTGLPKIPASLLFTKLLFVLFPSNNMTRLDAYPPSDIASFILQSINPFQIYNSFPIIMIFFFLWTVPSVPISCSLLGVIITSQNSVYRETRLCSSIALSCYLVLPALIPVASSLPVPFPPPCIAPPLRPTLPLTFPSTNPS